MLHGAIDLIRERGVAGVTVDAIVSRSNAPRGSVYYHFPEGRTQIVREALDQAGDLFSEGIEQLQGGKTDPKQALASFVEFWKGVLVASDFNAGCPFVAATVDGIAEDPALRDIVSKNFDYFQVVVSDLFVAEGRERAVADRQARLVVAAISGATVLCRAKRSLEPLDDVAEELSGLLG